MNEPVMLSDRALSDIEEILNEGYLRVAVAESKRSDRSDDERLHEEAA